MATTTPLQGTPVPTSTDSPNGPAQMTAMASFLDARSVMRFASASARATAFAAAGVTPTWGMLSYRTDGDKNGFEYYNGTAASWRVYGRYRDYQTLAGATSAITFSSIPTYLRTINIQINARSDAATIFTDVSIRIGGDAGAQYRHIVTFNQNATWSAPVAQSGVTSARIGYINANTTAGGLFGAIRLDLIGWDGPKAGALRGLSQSGYYDTGGNYVSSNSSIDYAGANAYTSVTVLCGSGNFVANSEFVLSGQE
jgi:hypothetical protein